MLKQKFCPNICYYVECVVYAEGEEGKEETEMNLFP